MSDNPAIAWGAQALGILAFLVSLRGYLSPDDRRMKAMMTVGTACFAMQFVLFGSWLVAVSLLMNTARTWLSIHRRGLRWFLPIAALQLAVGMALAQSPRDAFPIAGSIIGSYGLLCLRGIPLRAAMLATTAMWFVNNLVWGSIGGVLLDGLNASAHIRAICLLRAMRTRNSTETHCGKP